MTQNSEHGFFVRGYEAQSLGANQSVDTGATRDAVVNNGVHLLDQSTQVVAQMVQRFGAAAAWQLAVPDTAVFKRLPDFPEIRFPLPINPASGNSMQLMTRLRIKRGGVSAGTVKFRVCMWWAGNPPGHPDTSTEIRNVAEVSTSNTTSTDLSPSLVYITGDSIRANLAQAYASRPSLLASGALGAGQFIYAGLTVWASSTDVNATPVLEAMTARLFMKT